MKLAGMPSMPSFSASLPLGSRNTTKGTGDFFRKASMSDLSSSRLTATTTNPWGPYLSCSSLRAGNDLTHGPHQEAQKSTSTTLSARSGTEPSSLASASLGKDSPTLGEPAHR